MNEKKVDWPSLVLAIISVTCFCMIGIYVAEGKPLNGVISGILGVLVVGLGFMRKKRRRERGEL